MAFFGYLPVPRLLPYEVEPFDLPPVLRRDPSQLDEAGVQPYQPSFGALMPPAPLQFAQGQALDPSFVALVRDSKGNWHLGSQALELGIRDRDGAAFKGSQDPFGRGWGLRAKLSLLGKP